VVGPGLRTIEIDASPWRMWIVSYLEGDVLPKVTLTEPVLSDFGTKLAAVGKALMSFPVTEASRNRDSEWDLVRADKVVAMKIEHVPLGEKREILDTFMAEYRNVRSHLSFLLWLLLIFFFSTYLPCDRSSESTRLCNRLLKVLLILPCANRISFCA
jgi:hypothetical protein